MAKKPVKKKTTKPKKRNAYRIWCEWDMGFDADEIYATEKEAWDRVERADWSMSDEYTYDEIVESGLVCVEKISIVGGR